MKVLQLGKFDSVGGVESYIRTLATGLSEKGVKLVNLVANDRPSTDAHDAFGYQTVRAACWGTAFSMALSPSLPWLARRLHSRLRFDIVHINFPNPLGQLAAMCLPRSVKRVISWHSDIVRQKTALRFYGPFQQRFTRDADAIIAATPQHFSTSTQIPPPRDAQVRAVIPYGFEPAPFALERVDQRRFTQLMQITNLRPTIFAVGRHVAYKGFDVLLHAMRTVDALLWLGGDGPLTEQLRALSIELGIASRVVFAGRIPANELSAYYYAADVFAMPSTDRSEAFGIVQQEAMCCAKPVVSTLLGNGVEFVNQQGVTGLLVPPRDPAALAAALNRLLADPALRNQMGAAGRARVENEFSVAQMVDKTLDVYRRVLT